MNDAATPAITLDVLEAELAGIEGQHQELKAIHQNLTQEIARCEFKLVELGGQRSLVSRLIETARRWADAQSAPSDAPAAD